MQALICGACHRPMEREGFDFSLLRAAMVSAAGEVPRLTRLRGNKGVLSASLCLRCGERLSAIVRHKLHDPCPTCEVAPMAEGDARTRTAPPRDSMRCPSAPRRLDARYHHIFSATRSAMSA